MFHNGEGEMMNNNNIQFSRVRRKHKSSSIMHMLALLQCWVFIINVSQQIAIDYLSVIILSQVNYVYHNTSELVASDHLKRL